MDDLDDKVKVIDGVEYTVMDAMVRRPKQPAAIVTAFKGIMALAVGLPAFMLVAPIWYLLMLNKSISQRGSSIFIPILMPAMDKAFREVKKELLKGLHGRVLDVGAGAGDWLKYLGKASYVMELEPNIHHLPNLKKATEAFRKENPNVEVEIVTKFVSELDPRQPYDYIIFGNVLCEVPDPKAFLIDIDKVLKPGGKIIFQEHVKRPEGTFMAWFQDVFNLWYKTSSDGCNCNRKTVETMRSMKQWKVFNWYLRADNPPFLDRMAVGVILKDSGSTAAQSTTARM